MRVRCWLPTLLMAAVLAAQGYCAEFPYSAYVHGEAAAVHSGPSDEFYVTDQLAWGSKVEVFRHEPGGWAAIRPPAGSFSWVPADAVEPTEDPSLVRTVKPRVMTRVGSSLSTDMSAEYIQLELGEVLEVLGERLVESQSGPPKRWLKVAPVAGEFRWIRLDQLTNRPPGRGSDRAKPDPINTVDHAASRAADSAADQGASVGADFTEHSILERSATNAPTPADQGITTVPIAESTRSASSPTALNRTRTAGAQPADATLADDSTGQWQSRSNVARPKRPTPAEPPAPAPSLLAGSSTTARQDSRIPAADAIDAQLDELDLQLSQTVAQPVQQWELEPLRDQIQWLASQRVDSHQRRRLDQLAVRLERFDRVQQRYAELLHGSPETRDNPTTDPNVPRMLSDVDAVRLVDYETEESSSSAAPAIGSDVPLGPESAQAQAVTYNGEGWLMPVYTSRTDVPAFALTDDDGRILQFVSAGPGLNLRRYQRRRVGILGKEGYLAALRKPHLTAERVVLIDRHRE